MFLSFFITIVTEAVMRAAAVGGIATLWARFTLEAFKICTQIVYPPQFHRCDECSNNFTRELFSSNGKCKFCAEKDDLCDECQERFLDN